MLYVRGGILLWNTEACCGSGSDGGGDEALTKVGGFGAGGCDEEEKNLPRLMNPLSSLFFCTRNLPRKCIFSSYYSRI